MLEPKPNPTKIFKQIAYFADLDDDTLDKIIASAIQLKYQKEETVFWEGDKPKGLYILGSGWLKVVKFSETGREQVLRFLEPGESFNSLSIFSEKPHPATVIVLEPAVLWFIRRDAMLSLLDDHPKLARLIIQDLSDRLIYALSLVQDISLRSVEARLARYLLQQREDNLVPRKKWETQATIASRLGTVPDVLGRVFRKLETKQIIKVSRNEIEILDENALINTAEQ